MAGRLPICSQCSVEMVEVFCIQTANDFDDGYESWEKLYQCPKCKTCRQQQE